MLPEKTLLLASLNSELFKKRQPVLANVDWEVIDQHAKTQGVVSFAYAGMLQIKNEIPPELLQKWKQTTLSGVLRNEQLMRAQDELLHRLSNAEIAVVILKGSSVARYYPQPDLRILGDIDILVREEHIATVGVILKDLGYVEHEADHDFHIGYSRRDAYVEVHYNVTKLPNSRSGQATQKVVDRFLDCVEQGRCGTHTFPVLSEPNQAVSLLLHMVRHMFEGGIGLRQLCDWAVFANANASRFAEDIVPTLKMCGLLKYAKVATKTCVIYLGLDQDHHSWCDDIDSALCQSFMDAVFSGGNMGAANQDGMGSLLTDQTAGGDTDVSSLCALIKNLNKIAYKHFPVAGKAKILLPFFWIFLPARYAIRSVTGLRPRKSVTKVLFSAKKQRDLYEELAVFKTTD